MSMDSMSVTAQTQVRRVNAALISYSMAGSVGSPKFIYLGIDFSDHLDQQITDSFFQITPNKCQAYRIKVLFLT